MDFSKLEKSKSPDITQIDDIVKSVAEKALDIAQAKVTRIDELGENNNPNQKRDEHLLNKYKKIAQIGVDNGWFTDEKFKSVFDSEYREQQKEAESKQALKQVTDEKKALEDKTDNIAQITVEANQITEIVNAIGSEDLPQDQIDQILKLAVNIAKKIGKSWQTVLSDLGQAHLITTLGRQTSPLPA